MNTYMVEVNNHFLVRIEIEGSALAAEHYWLDGFKCVWGANAYDEKGMKTDCFRGAVLTCELITQGLLEEHLHRVDEAADAVKSLNIQIGEIEKQIAQLKQKRDELSAERDAEYGHYEKLFTRCNCQSR